MEEKKNHFHEEKIDATGLMIAIYFLTAQPFFETVY